MKYKTPLFPILLLTILFPFGKTAAHWNNFILNFNKDSYKGASQIWQISVYGEGNWMYFASKNGLLQFDGSEWNTFTLNNELEMRSVYCSTRQGRVYFGGIHEFGYLEPDIRGKMVYTCLSDSLDEKDRFSGNIWNIFETDNIFYFQADGKVIKLLKDNYTVIEFGEKIDCSALIDNTLYVGTPAGVYVLVGNTFFPIQDDGKLKKERIRGFIPYKKGLLIATAYNGLFYYDGYQASPFITGVEHFLSENEVFTISSSDKKISIGTVHKGIVLLDKETLEAKYFNENNGLQNNTVLSLCFDPKGNLWAGLNNGLDYICLNSPFTSLYAYPNSLGTGYCSALSEGKFYFGTNRGLYYTDYPVKLKDEPLNAKSVPHTSGQVWNLRKIGNDLFCMHDRGLFIISGGTAKKIGDIGGVWDCKPLYPGSSKMLLGTYSGFYLLEKRSGEWKIIKHIEGSQDSVENFEIEDGHIIWLQSNRQGMDRVELDTLDFTISSIRNYGISKGLPNIKHSYVNNLDGVIYFTTKAGIYQYDKSTDSLVYNQEINEMLQTEYPFQRIFKQNGNIIAVNEQQLAIIGRKDGKPSNIVYSLKQYAQEPLKQFKDLLILDDTLIVIPNESGFTLLDTGNEQVNDSNTGIHIKYMYVTSPRDSLVYSSNFTKEKHIPELSYAHRNVKLEYGVFSFTENRDILFRHRLKDADDWSELSPSHVKEYSKLAEGTYTFQVEAVFPDETVYEDEFTFTILPPWYRTSTAYVCYAVLFILLMWLVYKWDDSRLVKKKRMAVLEKEKEMQIIEQQYQEESARKEKQIMELEKEKLENKLQHKSQEMANLMINFMRKNEILTEIKQELYKVIAKMSGEQYSTLKKMLLIINSKIDSNIQSDDTLKRVEEEFDLVHNNFIKKLTEKYPDLSLNEKMMCTYLKMNLSTKEIAPLLNLSTRGVETLRYRLRKKFCLERDESLTAYLHQIS